MWMVNCLLIMIGTVAGLCGISFYWRNKDATGNIRFYIFSYGISSALWCISYGFLGITDQFAVCEVLRKIGIAGIDVFLVTEVFLAVTLAELKRKTAEVIRTIAVLFSIADFYFFSYTGLDIFIRKSTWTTWQADPAYTANRILHGVYCLFSFVVLFSLAIVWGRKSRLKRFRRFWFMVFISNIIMIPFSVPDTLFPMIGLPSVSTSGFGGAACAIVMWYGATQLHSFDIRMGNIKDRIFDFLEAGVLVFDMDFKLVLVNMYAAKLGGRQRWEGYQLTDFFDLKETDKEKMFAQAEKGICATRLWDKERKKAYSVRLKSVEDDYGDAFCYMCIFMDVTEEVETASKLKIASQAKSRFLAQMSHEIRTPINAVLGMNAMILRESQDEEILEYSEGIDSAGKTLLSLINSILDFSKIEDGKMDIIPVRYDTASFINDLVNSVAQRAEAKGLAFVVEADEMLPCAMVGDDVRVSQVIVNLLTNAVKYTKKGSVTLTIRENERIGDRISLFVSVKDTGIGIKEADICRLFESFERLDEVRNRNIEGTGLGITIIKNLLDMMGSRLSVESNYGEGSVFSFTIDQKIADAAPMGNYEKRLKDSFRQRDVEEMVCAPQARILLVDDNDMNLKVAKNLLKLCGIKPDMVSSGLLAIEAMREHTYDIVFLDHMMPGLDGIETLHRLQEENLIPQETAMVALTANAVVGARENYLKEGFHDYLSKPIDIKQLVKKLKQYLPEEAYEINAETEEDESGKMGAENPEEDEILEFAPVEDSVQPDTAGSVHEGQKEIHFDLSSLKAAGIDPDMGLRYCAGDVSLYYEMLCDYSANCTGKVKDLEERYLAQNWHEYEILVHAVKSNLKTIGADGISGQAGALEEAAKRQDEEYIESHHGELLENCEKLAQDILNAKE